MPDQAKEWRHAWQREGRHFKCFPNAAVRRLPYRLCEILCWVKFIHNILKIFLTNSPNLSNSLRSNRHVLEGPLAKSTSGVSGNPFFAGHSLIVRSTVRA
jgi:hypothetical protein